MEEQTSKENKEEKSNNEDHKKGGDSEEIEELAQGVSGSIDADDSSMEKLRKYLENKLHVFAENFSDQEVNPILEDTTLDGVIAYIKKNNVKRIITMAGAGISTSAGIPDFRSPKSGLYDNLEKYNLPHPQAIFAIDFFKENPEPFFALAKELLPEGFKPTPCHYFIKLLHEEGLLLRHYTQNIDTLERVAGLPVDKIVEAHGTFHTGRCLVCRAPYDLPWMKKKIMEGIIPICEECDEGVVKPDIIFFGEILPERFHILLENDFPQAELLIIMGSSLVVQPFASLIDKVKPSCPRILINKEKVGAPDRISRMLGINSGLNFESRSNRDVALLGDCDTLAELFAEKMGWGQRLKELVSKEHERLEKEHKLEKLKA